MTFDEVCERKRILQRDILSLVRNFESETQSRVESVSFNVATSMSGARDIISIHVRVEVP